MATLSASKTDGKEGLYLKKASLPQYRPVPNGTQSSRYRLRSSTKTQVEGEVDHARRQVHPISTDSVRICVLPQDVRSQYVRQQSCQDPDRELRNQEFGLTSSLNTQFFRHDQTWRCSYSQSKASSSRRPASHRWGKVDRYLKPDSNSDFDASTPPPPSDLEALRKTWEQVRVYKTKISKSGIQTISSISMTGTFSTIGEEEVLHPRGGKIEWAISESADQIWIALHTTVLTKLNEDSGVRDQLQRAGIWLFPETPDEGLEIQKEIKVLENDRPTVEAEWSDKFWKRYFFKIYPQDGHILQQWVERRQTHTLNQKESALQSNSDDNTSTSETKGKPPENRYPPILKQPRSSVTSSKDPYDVDPNRQRNGYAFSDISYAIKIRKDGFQKNFDLARLIPTLRLYADLIHYLEDLKIEVKPLAIEGRSNEWPYKFSVRYLTLTGMTMLHEWLKLCYISSDDSEFFPRPEYFTIHLISAVGHTVRHYIHNIREGTLGQSVRYVSYCVGTFDLKQAKERNNFRNRLNEIHVLHVTAFKEAMQNIVHKIFALTRPEIQRRINERAHKNVGFNYSKHDGIWGFSVRRDGENPSLSLPSPSDTQSITSNTTKASKSKDNKDGALTAFASQASTLVERMQDGKPRCQAWLKTQDKQCPYIATSGELSCKISLHQASVREQLAHPPYLSQSVSLSLPVRGAKATSVLKSKIPISTSKSTRKA